MRPNPYGVVDQINDPGRRALRVTAAAVCAMAALAGCAHQHGAAPLPTAANPSPWAAPTATLRWNEYAIDLIARNQAGQLGSARSLAYLNLAINNAMVAAQKQGRKPVGVASGASAAMLAFLFPKDEAAINARVALETASLGAAYRADFTAGVDVGRAAAADVIALAKSDRIGQEWTGSVPTGAGMWASQLKPPRPPLAPQLGGMRPFLMASGSEFRSAPPAADSPQFRTALAEVRKISDNRTDEQLRVAQFWEALQGGFAAGMWNEQARAAISARGMSEAESARSLAVLHMALVDVLIACHDAKYVYWVPRPAQLDPAITMTIGLPNHPSFPSNGAAINTVAGTILDAQFPEQGGRFAAMARQGSDSRFISAIHFRFDVDAGEEIGRKVAERALKSVPADRPFAPLGK